jgi:hypothetical protein
MAGITVGHHLAQEVSLLQQNVPQRDADRLKLAQARMTGRTVRIDWRHLSLLVLRIRSGPLPCRWWRPSGLLPL